MKLPDILVRLGPAVALTLSACASRDTSIQAPIIANADFNAQVASDLESGNKLPPEDYRTLESGAMYATNVTDESGQPRGIFTNLSSKNIWFSPSELDASLDLNGCPNLKVTWTDTVDFPGRKIMLMDGGAWNIAVSDSDSLNIATMAVCFAEAKLTHVNHSTRYEASLSYVAIEDAITTGLEVATIDYERLTGKWISDTEAYFSDQIGEFEPATPRAREIADYSLAQHNITGPILRLDQP